MDLSQFCLNAFDRFLLPKEMANGTVPYKGGAFVSEMREEAAVLLLISAKKEKKIVPPSAAAHSLPFDLEWHILLTVRSHCLRRHPGEVCFPGGMLDADTDRNPTDTALREAYEEVGLPSAFVHIVGTLRPVFTSRNVRIVPIVALLSNNFCPLYSSEVETHFWAPLSRFLGADEENSPRKSAGEEIGRLCSFDFALPTRQNAVVFGITAALCVIAAVVIHRPFPKIVERANRLRDNADEQFFHNVFGLFSIGRVAAFPSSAENAISQKAKL